MEMLHFPHFFFFCLRLAWVFKEDFTASPLILPLKQKIKDVQRVFLG